MINPFVSYFQAGCKHSFDEATHLCVYCKLSKVDFYQAVSWEATQVELEKKTGGNMSKKKTKNAIGINIESAKVSKNILKDGNKTLLKILASPHADEETKRVALQVAGKLSGQHTTVSGCNVRGPL